jgi:BirA family biotin operon repressor/biotin-[acetyl-CoA-carboxylase] ligase
MPFIELQTIDSTNNYALGQIQASRLPGGQDFVPHGFVVFSHEQTAGKGQRGKKWTSEARGNIAMSIALNPYPLHVSQQFHLSVCVAESLHQLFSKYAGGDTRIKWPNDLYWRDRKAGGILIESIVGSNKPETGNTEAADFATNAGQAWEWAVVGIGINVNQARFPPDLPNAVSLKQITGKNYDPVEMGKELCVVFDQKYNKLIAGGFGMLFNDYLSHLYKKNEKVRLRKENRVFEVIIKSVSPSGRLIVQHSIEEEFDFGSVEWITNG